MIHYIIAGLGVVGGIIALLVGVHTSDSNIIAVSILLPFIIIIMNKLFNLERRLSKIEAKLDMIIKRHKEDAYFE